MVKDDGNGNREDAPELPTRCPRCGRNPLVADGLQKRLVCTHCGYVARDLLPRKRLSDLARSERRKAETPLSRERGFSPDGGSEGRGNRLGDTLSLEGLSDILRSECLISLYRSTRKLGLSDSVRERAIELIALAGRNGLNLKQRPVMIAGAAIYLAGRALDANSPRAVRVARAVGRSEEEIRITCRAMSQLLEVGAP